MFHVRTSSALAALSRGLWQGLLQNRTPGFPASPICVAPGLGFTLSSLFCPRARFFVPFSH